jgi:cytochrome c
MDGDHQFHPDSKRMFRVRVIFILLVFYCSCSKEYREHDQEKLPERFGIGREATPMEIARWNTDVRPDGTGLPAGKGDALQGKVVYMNKCARCHGSHGYNGPYQALVTAPPDSIKNKDGRKEKTIGNYWPYASTIYDYINRAMPFDQPGSLTPDEVYSLTAYLLDANHIIDSVTVMNATTLPKVNMPAHYRFVNDDRKGGPEIK